MTLAELRAAREAAGARIIALRKESMVDGFAETAEWSAGWDAANATYNAALAAEETGIRAEALRGERDAVINRITEDAGRISAAERDRLRPNFDPRTDPRSSGRSGMPSLATWNTAVRCWMAARSDDFDPTDAEVQAMRQCRLINKVNHIAEQVILPTGRAHAELISRIQEAILTAPKNGMQRAVREAFATTSVWQTTDPESAGIVAEPPRVLREVEINMLAFGGLLQVCDTLTTGTAEDITLPFTDDTTVKGRRIAQNGSLGTVKNPAFGGITWGAWKYTSDVIAVTYEMLREAWFDLEGHIGNVGGERLGRVANDECTTGIGVDMPRGIVFSAEVGKTSLSSTVISSDDIVDLEHSVDPAYRNSPTVGFMFHDLILAQLRKLKDGEGQPIYTLGQENGGRDRLNNRPIFINMSMTSTVQASTVAAPCDPVLFGEMKKYRVRRVNGTRIVRDPYTQRMSNDRDLFAVITELDGNLINTGTCPVKKLRMKA